MLDIKKAEEIIRRYVSDNEKGFDSCKDRTINCYQFALGIFESFILRSLMPGEISGLTIKDGLKYTDEELVSYVVKDLELLGFKPKKCSEEQMPKENEWVICCMNGDIKDPYYDFHFLRKRCSGKNISWIQKLVDEQLPTDMDESYTVIRSPQNAHFLYKYHVVCFLTIS